MYYLLLKIQIKKKIGTSPEHRTGTEAVGNHPVPYCSVVEVVNPDPHSSFDFHSVDWILLPVQ
jgi:hypothetical protein